MSDGRYHVTTGGEFPVVLSAPAAQSLFRRVEHGSLASLDMVDSAAHPFLAVLLARLFPTRSIIVITDGLKTQELYHQDIQTWLKNANVPNAAGASERTLRFFPAWETLPHEPKLPHVDVISDRLDTLSSLASGRDAPCGADLQSAGSRSLQVRGRQPTLEQPLRGAEPVIIVTTLIALLQKTFPPGELRARSRILNRGDSADPLSLIEWLEEQGYEPEAQVAQKGTIALRGGILDLWPLTSPWPVRLEFFGDELTSLRYFDPFTQISKEEIPAVTIPPSGEIGILKRQSQTAAISGEPVSLLAYLPAETILVWCNPETIREQTSRYLQQVPGGDPFHLTLTAFDSVKKEMIAVELSDSGECDDLISAADSLANAPSADNANLKSKISNLESRISNLEFHGLEVFRPIGDRAPEAHIAEAQRKEFFSQLHRWTRQGYEICVFCNNDGERQRFEEIWKEYGLGKASLLQMRAGALARGFLWEAARLAVVTDAEIFGRYRVQRPRRLKSAHAQTSRSMLDINFAELEEGNYVVHLQHGIGRYLGLQVMPASQGRKPLDHGLASRGSDEECMVIEYAPSDPTQQPPKLYVPVSEAHLVGKYVGAGKARPPLNTLGGTRWAKAKAHAEHAVRDLAAEMLSIQAARESQVGFAYSQDTGWQREFENSFIYEETPDQWRAIVAAKKDLESPKPMDRLICGDVGYGKTEVAIRAAFKVALGGKQVAVLVPTTVLAQQHYNTFCERMADYPVRIDLLSRFRTQRQLRTTLRDLGTGAVDIVIGTHRLLQEDIAFKDLGLVVIDEEQRFGVMHKEKFKRLRALVDVLTLSATPIPRTLYMALAGARDMSTIETPPQDRLPVETIVTQYDERTIRDAIQREMNRGGQVFYLHNRVLDIENVAARLATLVPNARIAVGHGQMESDQLEEVMTSFVNGEVDVLLSTTIIESGLDIPNANTIIIDRADRFGLSDLYQLRGRVGRYKHQAYAYLLLPRHAGLLSDARKRISAIKQYSTLGSGFKIAMRDLEIRGAGNLLGSQQSGHITAVGFDLYCQLLKQSVSALKGEKVKPRVEVEVHLDFLAMSPEEHRDTPQPRPSRKKAADEDLVVFIPRDVAVCSSKPEEKTELVLTAKTPAYVPAGYIPEAQQRIEIHRKLAQATDMTALRALKDELRDRFGPLPPAVELLLKVRELKIIASEHAVSVIETKEGKVMLTRNNDYLMTGGKFPRLTRTGATARLNEIRRLLMAL